MKTDHFILGTIFEFVFLYQLEWPRSVGTDFESPLRPQMTNGIDKEVNEKKCFPEMLQTAATLNVLFPKFYIEFIFVHAFITISSKNDPGGTNSFEADQM